MCAFIRAAQRKYRIDSAFVPRHNEFIAIRWRLFSSESRPAPAFCCFGLFGITPMFRTILFDFDGTLIFSLDCWFRAFVSALDRYGIRMEESEIISRCFYRPYADVAKDLDIPSGQELKDFVHEGLTLTYPDAELFPGVTALLNDLRATGARMAIVTSSPREHVTATLETLGIREHFDVIVAVEDTTTHKPDPAPVLLALERLGSGPDGAIFIGDYIVDVQAGKAAGVVTGLHLPSGHTRFYDFDVLRKTEPDFAFSTFSELSDYLLPGVREAQSGSRAVR